MKNLLIDSKRDMAASRLVRQGRGARRVYSDHYSCLLTLTGLVRRQGEKTQKEDAKWNLAKEGGWDTYKMETDKYKEKFENVIEDEELSIQDKMDKIEKINTKIKFKAFGKVHMRLCKINPKDECHIQVFSELSQKAQLTEP